MTTDPILDRARQVRIIRAVSDELLDYLDTTVNDRIAELIAEATDADATEDDDAQDLTLSLLIESIDHALADMGWTLAPRTTPSDPH